MKGIDINMLAGCGLTIGAVSGSFIVNYLGRAKDTKFHIALLFGISFSIYVSVLSESFEEIGKICALSLIFCLLPLCYAFTISYTYTLIPIGLNFTIAAIVVSIGFFQSNLNSEFFLLAIDYIYLIFQALSLCICTIFVSFGYSQIPELLITPPLKHFFKKSSLETSRSHVEKAISNIGYNYICRGLPTPKYELANLKTMEKELEEVKEKLVKFEKNSLDNKFWQVCMVVCGCFLVCAGFWTYLVLMGVLIEGIAMSECGWQCGFESESRINGLFSDVLLVTSILISIVYLATALIGYIKLFNLKKKENISEHFLGLTAITCMAAVGLEDLLEYLFPNHYSTGLSIISFSTESLLCSMAFLLFIYSNFLKCKKRKDK